MVISYRTTRSPATAACMRAYHPRPTARIMPTGTNTVEISPGCGLKEHSPREDALFSQVGHRNGAGLGCRFSRLAPGNGAPD